MVPGAHAHTILMGPQTLAVLHYVQSTTSFASCKPLAGLRTVSLLYCSCISSPRQMTPVQVEVKDCVGCGDSMGGAIVLGFIQKRSLSATLTLANAGELSDKRATSTSQRCARSDLLLKLAKWTSSHDAPPWPDVSWTSSETWSACTLLCR